MTIAASYNETAARFGVKEPQFLMQDIGCARLQAISRDAEDARGRFGSFQKLSLFVGIGIDGQIGAHAIQIGTPVNQIIAVDAQISNTLQKIVDVFCPAIPVEKTST